ncbi:MAG: methyltransferase [Oligoflexales bacterium]|nr:methyltransferase [Oligoflexales bacterium]
MTSRERILEAVSHRPTDSLPIDFGGMRSTGIHAKCYSRLRDHLGIKGGAFKIYDIFQQLAEPEIPILERMGGDVMQVHRLRPAFGIRIDLWKKSRLPEGHNILIPETFNPKIDEFGNSKILDDEGHVLAVMPQNGHYYDPAYHPWAECESIADIDKIQIPEVTDDELLFLENQARYLFENTDKAILLAFGGNIFEGGQLGFGYEKFYMDLAMNQDMIHYWADRITSAYIRDLENILRRVGKYVHIVQFGDDLGTQEALQISIPMYREMIRPYHTRLYQYVRQNFPGINVFLHSCGAISDLIPDLIETGVQILNPVQISAQGMNPIKLKREFGSHLTFWGGGANMQSTVTFGTVSDIKKEVRELIEIFSKGGGYVFNQVHNIQSDIPPEKVMAIYDTAMEFRRAIGGR